MPTYKPIPESVIRRSNEFGERVKVNIESEDDNQCFPWGGRIDSEGYGRTGQNLYAHRVAFTLTKGAIPDGYTIDHLCQNRACCNPDHLEAVTASENVRRRKAPTTEPSKYANGRKRGPERCARRRARGTCVQCNTPSDKYRCDRCREIHNQRDKGRKR